MNVNIIYYIWWSINLLDQEKILCSHKVTIEMEMNNVPSFGMSQHSVIPYHKSCINVVPYFPYT